MDFEKEFIKVIRILLDLGYSKQQIDYGINKLDENKHSTWNTALIIRDIIDNIEKRKKLIWK